MNQGILNILNPMHALPDTERERKLQEVATEYPVQWDAVQFMLQEGHPELAVRYLKQLCNPALHQAGELLSICLREMEMEQKKELAKAGAASGQITVAKAEHTEENFQTDSKSIVFNV